MTSVYLINRMPSKSLNMISPFKKLYNKEVNYNNIRLFGCQCFPYLRDINKSKFARRTYPCVFIGYSSIHKSYRSLDPLTNRVYISRHVVFDEEIFPFDKTMSNKLQEAPRTLEVTDFVGLNNWFGTKAISTQSQRTEACIEEGPFSLGISSLRKDPRLKISNLKNNSLTTGHQLRNKIQMTPEILN